MPRVRINRAALNKALREQPFQDALDDTVGALKDKAEEINPEGKYRGGYSKRRYRTRKFPLSRRLFNTDTFFHLIEFGSENNPVYAPMRRAARALGLRLKETPK